MIAVDTNVFIYALDDDDKIKQSIARQLLSTLAQPTKSTLFLWQVAGELLNWLHKWDSAGQIAAVDVAAHFSSLLNTYSLAIPSDHVFQHYFALHSRYSLSHWDAMLLAACRQAGVTTLYSEDLTAGADYDGVTIINPFARVADALPTVHQLYHCCHSRRNPCSLQLLHPALITLVERQVAVVHFQRQ
jgi:predicted nucleic acid-binding protein